MIAFIHGTILHRGDTFIVVTSGDIGYKIFPLNHIKERVTEGEEISLWIHHAHNDSGDRLYGFEGPHDLFFFELLTTVSGIGPKTAQNILNVASVETLQQAVIENDPTHITKISGIGKKNAEKIVLELRDKIHSSATSPAPSPRSSADGDVVDALLALGYSQKEARAALQKIPKEIEGAEDRIRAALKNIGS